MYFQDALEYDDEIQETFDDWNDYEPDSTYCQDEAIDDMDNMFDTQEFDDIYSTYVDAKNRLNQLRQSRGFYPVVAVMESGKGQMPVMAQNPSKGKGKGSGKSKSPAKGKSPSKGGKGPMGKSRARSAMVCLRCGKPGHFSMQPTATPLKQLSRPSSLRSSTTLRRPMLRAKCIWSS